MKQVAGDHGPRFRANIGEENPDNNQQRNLSPGRPELLRVQHSEQRAGDNNARSHAETPREVISEYHILREVIFQVLETDSSLVKFHQSTK